MKNKVDIDKLIENKYKGNTLELNDLLDEIDLVLQESYQYTSKLDTGNLEENPQSINIHQRMYGAQGVRNERADEPGYGDNVDNLPQVRPTTVAEAGENTVSPGYEIQRGVKSLEVPVPDLYSLMTNPNLMKPETNERELVNEIMKNIGAGDSWQDRIAKLKNYTKFISIPDAGSTKKDITQTISSLMMLNVLKKLSYFTDHPGKQFEYVFAPFISPTAQVAGDEATEIADIKGVKGTAYSLKFLESGQLEIKGSITNLLSKINQGEVNFISYIICHPIGNGVIQLGTTGVSCIPDITEDRKKEFELFLTTNYSLVEGISSKNWKLFKRKADISSDMPKSLFLVLSGEQLSIATDKTKLDIAKDVENVGGANIPAQEFLSTKGGESSKMAKLIAAIEGNQKDKKDLNKLDKILRDNFPDYRKQFPEIPKYDDAVKYATGIVKKVKEIAKRLRDQTVVQSGESPFKGSQITSQNEAQQSTEQSTEQSSQARFKIPINRYFKTYIVEDLLNLGEVDMYNKQQVEFSNGLAKMYQNVLTNLQQLNVNITKYFSTDKGQDDTSANKAIDNAEAVKQNISGIVKS
jgi:conjugal transfer/entry exclusion protein